MEKLLIVKCGDGYSDEAEEVNRYLESGRRVKMISSAAAGAGQSLIGRSWAYAVLEKDGE